MIVKGTWTLTIIILAMALTMSSGNIHTDLTTTTESSFEYLRKVMLELRDLNPPPSQLVPTRETGSFHLDVDEKNYLAGKQHSTAKRIVKQVASNPQKDNFGFRTSLMQSMLAKKIEPIVIDQIADTATNNHYYQLPDAGFRPPVQRVATQEVSPLARPELDAVYQHAIERGSLNALANVLRHRQLPAKILDQVGIGETQPMYAYYYYPMQTVMNDVPHGNVLPGMLPAVDLRPETTGLAQDSQKEMGNPVFMAISGFIGMAVLFMIGVLLFPRLGDLSSRIVSNEEKFLELTKTVGEAMDPENCLNVPAHLYKDYRAGRLAIQCQPAKITK